MFELALLFGFMVVIEVMTFDHRIGAFGFHPHPYWIIILPFAAVRGVMGGLVAATIATVLYAIGAFDHYPGLTFLQLLDLEIMREPLLFLTVGFVVGELRESLSIHYKKLWDAFAASAKTIVTMTKERELLIEANTQLKRRLVDHSAQFNTLIETATRIEAATDHEVMELAVEMIQEHCGATACSALTVLEGAKLDHVASRGWRESDFKRRLEAANNSSLVQLAVRDGIRVNGFLSDVSPGDGPILVAPITDHNGRVRSLLCLDEIPAGLLNDSTVLTFFGIFEWINASLLRIFKAQTTMERLVPRRTHTSSMAPWLGTATALGDRVRIEDARCSRQGLITSLLAFQAVDLLDDSEGAFAQLDDFVLENFSRDLRPSDSMYRFGYPGCYLIVLPGANRDDADVVRRRLVQRTKHVVSTIVRRMEVTIFTPTSHAPDLASLITVVTDHFRERSPVLLTKTAPCVINDEMTAGTATEFLQRIKYEWSIALRHGTDLFVLDIKDEAGRVESGEILARHIEQISRHLLRRTDTVYRTGRGLCSIVLPGSTSEGAFSTLERLVEALESRIPKEIIRDIGGEVYALGVGYEEYRALLDSVLGDEEGEPR